MNGGGGDGGGSFRGLLRAVGSIMEAGSVTTPRSWCWALGVVGGSWGLHEILLYPIM